jgi:transposase
VRYVGIDIGAESHWVAVLDAEEEILVRPTRFGEDRAGYAKLQEALGAPADDVLIVMEATGHYWQNLFAFLASEGYPVALVNPLRTHHFGRENLERTKTDAVDALALARFARQKRPAPLRLPDEMTQELRELVRLRDQLTEDIVARVNQLHRLIDLGFPEFTRVVKNLDALATTLLSHFPTARSFASAKLAHITKLKYGNGVKISESLARELIAVAKTSVGAHHGDTYKREVAYACEDLETFRARLRAVSRDIDGLMQRHEIGKLLVTIPGIGPQTAARILAEAGDLDRFDSAAALACYAGLVPALKHSGKRTPQSAAISRIGNAKLRRGLYLPTITAVRFNPWLRAFYDRLVRAGKPKKVALIAAARKLLTAVYSVAKNKKPFVAQLPSAAADASAIAMAA